MCCATHARAFRFTTRLAPAYHPVAAILRDRWRGAVVAYGLAWSPAPAPAPAVVETPTTVTPEPVPVLASLA